MHQYLDVCPRCGLIPVIVRRYFYVFLCSPERMDHNLRPVYLYFDMIMLIICFNAKPAGSPSLRSCLVRRVDSLAPASHVTRRR